MKKLVLLLPVLFLMSSLHAQKKEKTGIYAKYEYVGSFNQGIAKVKLNKKWGYVDTTGNVLISPKYNEAENFSGGLARVRLGQKWGLVDTTGAEVIKPTFDWIYDYDQFGVAKVKLNGQEYYMDRKGIRVR
jgi:hypothetical protein